MQNNMPEKDTVSYRLISLIAIAGEMPATEIKRIPGGESYKKIFFCPKIRKDSVLHFQDNLIQIISNLN